MKELEQFLNQYEAQIREDAEAMRDLPMPELTEALFSEFEQNGNRIRYEAVYFTRRKYLAVFAAAVLLDEREEDCRQLENVIAQICEETCWALPAHVNRMENPGWELTIDLFASETAQALAEITTVLDGLISKEVCEQARAEIFRRVMNPFMDSAVPYAWWENSNLNWCAVCSGSIGSAAIYLMRDDTKKLDTLLERICQSLTHFVDGYSEDGACLEGLGYFTYGMTYYTGFAAQLCDYTNGKIDLLANEKVRAMAQFQQSCYFASGESISFSDGDSHEHFKVGISCYLSMRYPEVVLPNMKLAADFHQDSCYRWMSVCRDLIWGRQHLHGWNMASMDIKEVLRRTENGVSRSRCTVFPYAQWMICESRNLGALAVKGGNNDEPHNHNDIGNFIYMKNGQIVLPDLGAGEYTRDYFNENRYTIFTNHSFSHNVPIINGEGQKAGKEYACSRFFALENSTVEMELADAYEKGAIAGITRTVQFHLENGHLLVTDEFVPSEQTKSIMENLISYEKPEVEGHAFVIYSGTISTRIEVEGEDLEVLTQNHRDHAGVDVTVYCMRWKIPFTADQPVISRMDIR